MGDTDTRTRTLLVEFDSRGEIRGTHRVTIPHGAKVTFSGVNPQNGHAEKALRIYQSKDHQLACFVGVRSFRDEAAVTVQRRRRDIKVTHEDESKRDGRRSSHSVQAGPQEWVDVNELTDDDQLRV